MKFKTLHIPEELHRQVRIEAARIGQDIKDFVIDAIKARLRTVSLATEATGENRKLTQLELLFSQMGWSRKYLHDPDRSHVRKSWREEQADEAREELATIFPTEQEVIRSLHLCRDGEGQVLYMVEEAW